VAVTFVSALAMSVVIYAILSKELVGNPALIWAVIGAGAVAGAAVSLYWYFLMCWVSEDFEGPTLNRRLGT